MSLKKTFKAGYKDGKTRKKRVLNIRTGKVVKVTKLGNRVSSQFQSNLTGRRRKGNATGKTAATAGVLAGMAARKANNVKKGAYKMTAKHKAAISRALKGRKRS